MEELLMDLSVDAKVIQDALDGLIPLEFAALLLAGVE